MKRIGFYLSGANPVERVLPLLARAARDKSERLAVIAGEGDLGQRLSRALWEDNPADFLAHGMADEPHSARQPLVISQECEAVNGATTAIIADGSWRDDAEIFERVLMLFDDAARDRARPAWRLFDGRDEIEREFHELENGKWARKI